MHKPLPKVYCIVGPTAVGKTAVSIALAQSLETEILSADSRQCYQGMEIGTAMPDKAELALVKHHFIDCFPVETEVTAAGYERFALDCLAGIFREKDTAVVCGGTGLYVKALCEGLDSMPDINNAVKYAVEAGYKEKGLDWLQAEVQKEDPGFYAQGEIHNPARLLRALIFKRSTGESILNYRTQSRKERPFTCIKVGLELPREILYERINQRVDIMMQKGLLEEVKALYPKRHIKNLHTVGYSELFAYLDGTCSMEFAVEKIKQHSRNYAKRQLTWFKKVPDITWFSPYDTDIIPRILAL